ncbi:MAG: hypothetical protein NZ952_01100 [Candidatus Bathyarchaeota archaeon]|nr:hypothetical protein [Candidatus Bathyarchaeota archaeon]
MPPQKLEENHAAKFNISIILEKASKRKLESRGNHKNPNNALS